MTIYKCKNRYCKNKDREWSAMDIDDCKLATGRRVYCTQCGQVAWFVRREQPIKKEN